MTAMYLLKADGETSGVSARSCPTPGGGRVVA